LSNNFRKAAAMVGKCLGFSVAENDRHLSEPAIAACFKSYPDGVRFFFF
jgi:hypothetical protein